MGIVFCPLTFYKEVCALGTGSSSQSLLHWAASVASFNLIFFFISVSKPAPSFNGTAVIDGKFQQIKLSDFKGKSCMLAGTIVISL